MLIAIFSGYSDTRACYVGNKSRVSVSYTVCTAKYRRLTKLKNSLTVFTARSLSGSFVFTVHLLAFENMSDTL